MTTSKNSFNTLQTLELQGEQFHYYSILGGELASHKGASRLPVTTKILLENLLRHEDGFTCNREDIEALPRAPVRVASTRLPTIRRVFLCRTLPACLQWSICRRCVTRWLRVVLTPRKSIRCPQWIS